MRRFIAATILTAAGAIGGFTAAHAVHASATLADGHPSPLGGGVACCKT